MTDRDAPTPTRAEVRAWLDEFASDEPELIRRPAVIAALAAAALALIPETVAPDPNRATEADAAWCEEMADEWFRWAEESPSLANDPGPRGTTAMYRRMALSIRAALDTPNREGTP